MSATELIEKVRPMTSEEKRAFVAQLWEEFGDELGMLDTDLTSEQAAELDRRLAAFEKDPHLGVPLEQVQADLKKRFGWQ